MFVTRGVLRLVITVLACMALAAIGYLAMVIFAWNVISPGNAEP